MIRPFWRPIITATALVILGACGDDSSSAPATTTPVNTVSTLGSTTTTTTATTAATTATTGGASTTSPGSSTDDHSGPATVESTPLTGGGAKSIEFNADQVTTPTTETVKVNTPVVITITSAQLQEFHLHGYDLEFTNRLDFTADKVGTFELESHKTSKTLMVLVVTP